MFKWNLTYASDFPPHLLEDFCGCKLQWTKRLSTNCLKKTCDGGGSHWMQVSVKQVDLAFYFDEFVMWILIDFRPYNHFSYCLCQKKIGIKNPNEKFTYRPEFWAFFDIKSEIDFELIFYFYSKITKGQNSDSVSLKKQPDLGCLLCWCFLFWIQLKTSAFHYFEKHEGKRREHSSSMIQ